MVFEASHVGGVGLFETNVDVQSELHGLAALQGAVCLDSLNRC